MSIFSERLKHLRKSRGLTQKAIAEKLSIGERAYQHYEGDSRYPDFEGLLLLADILDTSLDYLVGRSDDPTMK